MTALRKKIPDEIASVRHKLSVVIYKNLLFIKCFFHFFFRKLLGAEEPVVAFQFT